MPQSAARRALAVITTCLALTLLAGAVAQASKAAKRHHPAAFPCPELLASPPSALPSGGSTDAGLASVLAVLRRPMSAGDEPPGAVVLGDDLTGALGVYDPDGIRLLQTVASSSYYLVPGRSLAFTASAHCLGALPPSLRAQIRAQQHPAQPAYCLLGASTTSIDQSLLCGLASDLSSGYSIYEGVHGSPRPNLVAGLVPDGVATVQLAFRGAGTVTAPVAGNLFLGTEPAALGRPITKRELGNRTRLRSRVLQRIPLAVTWLGPDGRVVARLTAPTQLVRQVTAEAGALSALLAPTRPRSSRAHRRRRARVADAASALTAGFFGR